MRLPRNGTAKIGTAGAFFVAAAMAMAPAVMPGSAVVAGKSRPPVYRWTNVTREAAFAARDGAGAVVFKDRMWLLGGWNPDDPRHFPTHCNSDVWSSADGVHWERVCEKAPWGPRVLHYTVAFDGKIWVMGGQTLPQFAPADEAFYSDVWNSTDGVTWKRLTGKAPWGPRGMIGGAAVLRNRIWILGGGIYDTPGRPGREFRNDVWSSADGVHWDEHTSAAPWHPRQYHDVAAFDGRLWVMEGFDGKAGNRRDVWHSVDGKEWIEVPGTPWAPRHAASVFVHENALWMAAGNNMEPDVWKLTRVK